MIKKKNSGFSVVAKFFLCASGIYMAIFLTIVFLFKHVFPYIRETIINIPYSIMILISMFFGLLTTISFVSYVYKNRERLTDNMIKRMRERREKRNARANHEEEKKS